MPTHGSRRQRLQDAQTRQQPVVGRNVGRVGRNRCPDGRRAPVQHRPLLGLGHGQPFEILSALSIKR